MTRTIRRQPQFYQLSHFAEWGRREDAESRATDLIGHMRSAHLFRSRSAPLHHEFTLVCYGRPGIADSWVRVERAARHKAHALMPQLDSFGPIFGGVELRESVSFASQMEDLNENADELCSVTTLAEADFTDHMLISEFAAQLNETSSADPLYRLFSANCRWFARRSILSIAHRLTVIRAVESIHWKGQSIDAEELGAKLLDDRFGGRQLAGTRGIEIRASGFINLARTSLIAHRYSSTIEQGHKALKLLETIEAPNKVQLDLIYNACWYLGSAYNARDTYFEAFRYLQRARDIAEQIGGRTLLMDETYAANLQNIGRPEDALAVRKNIIDTLRGEEPYRHPFTLEIFGNTLIPYASHLLPAGQVLEALNIIEEGVSIRRRLMEYRPDLHSRSLGQALSVLGSVYLKLDRIEEAYNVSLEALQVTRQVFNVHPEATRHNMALRLYNYSIACLRSHRPEDSLHAAEECVELWSLLYEQDPSFHLADYSRTLHHLGDSLYLADRHSEAVSKLQEWLRYETKLLETDGPRYRTRFAELGQSAAQVLFLVGGKEAIGVGEDVLAHTRILAEQHPQVCKPVLAERLVSLALCALVVYLEEKPFATEAFRFGYKAAREAGVSWLDLADSDSESHAESLGQAFSLLARYHVYANEPLPAISAASKSYNALIKTMSLVNDKKAKKMKEALSSWTLAINSLYSTAALEGLPYALEYLAAYRALSMANPTTFCEEDFSERLWTHAIWMTDKLQIKEGVDELFQEAIDVARRLCARYAPTIDEPHSSALMHALYAYGTYLAADHEFAEASTAVDALGEALNIVRELSVRDVTKYSQMFVRIAVAYSSALDDVNRRADALETSTEAVSRARSLQRGVLAEALHLHCALLHKSGQSQDAYRLCLEYVTTYRDLFAQNPDKHRMGLASGLNNLGGFLHSLGREAEAIDAGIEALDHFRVIRRHDQSSIQPAFGALLRTLAHAVDEDPNTLRSRKAAVALAQVYYELDSDTMGSNLLNQLLRYAVKLAEHGESEDAIATGKKALEHARTMFHQDESGCRGQLANVLDNLAADILHAGNPVVCLPYAEECVAHYRVLCQEQPAEYRENLAHSLYVHASALIALHRLDEALLVCDEGISFARDTSANEQSMEARRALAEALVGKSKLCAEQDRSSEEHELLEEAIGLWRSICEASPDDLLNIAEIIGRHAVRMWHAERKDGGWILACSALDLERQLFASNPDTHRARFAQALLQHAGFSEGMDLQDVTLSVGREAIALSRVLYQQDVPTFREVLASRLCQHATFCANGENETEAADLLGEALPLLRELVASDRDTHLIRLVDALHDHFLRSWRTEQISDAVPSLAEYITGLRELELKEPGNYRDAIENGVKVFKAVLGSVGDQFCQYADAEFLRDSPPDISDHLDGLSLSEPAETSS
jgi:tetratricopeptide (TPR) repeat protein